MHASSLVSLPAVQLSPPLAGSGESHRRLNNISPLSLQECNWDHSDQPPFPIKEAGKMLNFTFKLCSILTYASMVFS